MIYSLYHWWTNTPMDENGLPWYIDVLGGILDAVLVVGLLMVLSSGPAMAATNNTTTTNATLNSTAPYYVHQTSVNNLSYWLPEGRNVSLDIIGRMVTRLGPYVIGHGQPIPGGTTYAGTILTGFVFIGVAMGAFAFTGAGGSSAVVIAAALSYGLVDLGLAPSWLKLVYLFIVGIAAAVAVLRVTR